MSTAVPEIVSADFSFDEELESGNYFSETPLRKDQGAIADAQVEFDLVCSLLHDHLQWNEVRDITPNMFSDPNCREIWAYIYDKGAKVAPAGLKDALEKTPAGRRALADIGAGRDAGETINFLYQQGRLAGPAENLREIVRNNATLRFVQQAQAEVRPERFSNAAEYASALATKLQNVASRMAPNVNPQALSDGLDDALSHYLFRQANQGKIIGVKTGLEDYDHQMGGLHGGEVIMIGGHSGEGKTQLKGYMALNAALTVRDDTNTPAKVAYFSLEMVAREMANRWIACAAQVDLRNPNPTNAQMRAVNKAVKQLKVLSDSRRLIMFDPSAAHTLDQIVRALHKAKEEDDIDAAFIDYAQLIRVTGGSSDSSKYDQMASVAQRFKIAAQQLNIVLGVGVQLNRDAMTSSAAGRPKVYHIADSMDLVRSADGVQMIWTPARHLNYNAGLWKNIAVILTEKMRSRPLFDPLYYQFDPSRSSFYELDPTVKAALIDPDGEAQTLLKKTRAAATKKDAPAS